MKTTIPLTILPIEDDGYHLLLTIQINDKPANLILDTGASRTVFDENSIVDFLGHNNLEEQDKLSSGLGTNTMTSKKVVVDKLELGDIEILNYEATILDLTHVNQSYQKLDLPIVVGILGGDILHDFNAKVDYQAKTLLLSS